MALRGVGIDVADLSRIAALVRSRGDRFTTRWFTAAEIAECEADVDPVAGYAGRLAAKEAVWKAIGVAAGEAVPWRSIAVLADGRGLVRAELGGELAAAAAGAGVGPISVSWTVRAGVATAIALAEQIRVPDPLSPARG